MPKFLLAYHGPAQPMPPEHGQDHMARWMAWMEGLGAAVVDRGTPVGKSKTVSADGTTETGGLDPISGITILQADDMDAAIEMARLCPHLGVGGTIEVAPVMDMKM